MASNDIIVKLKATDDATAVFKKFQEAVEKAKKPMEDFTKSTSSLTGYMKEQKREGRLHSFVISDIKDALGAAGLAMNLMGDSTSGTNNQMKLVTDSMNKGIVAFYGLDAVVGALSKTFKFLGGGIGLAITVIGSLAIAVGDYVKKSKESSEAIEVEISGHDRIINRLKDVKGAYEATTTIKQQLFKKDKTEIEENIILMQSWIDSDKLKLTSVNSQILAADESQKSTKLRLLIEQTGLLNNIEINKVKIQQGKEDLSRIQQTIDLQTKLNSVVKAESDAKLIEKKVVEKKVGTIEDPFILMFQNRLTTSNLINSDILTGEQILAGRMKFTSTDLAAHEVIVNAGRMEQQKAYGEQSFAIFQGLASGMGAAIGESTQPIKGMLKAIANSFLDLAQAQLLASQAFAAGKAIFTSGFSLTKDIAQVFIGLAAISAARSFVARMHTGGTAFVNAPANREVPIMVRGQETIRVNTPEQERRSSGGGIVINFNSPVSDVAFTRNSILKVLKETGLSIESAFINQSNKVSIA